VFSPPVLATPRPDVLAQGPPPEKVQGEEVEVEVGPEDSDDPWVVLEYMKGKVPGERDEFKPSWLRDFQASQR